MNLALGSDFLIINILEINNNISTISHSIIVPAGEITQVNVRMDAKDFEALQKLAEQNGMSASAFLSRMAKSYLEWEYIAPKVGLIPIQKEMVKDLMDAIPEDTLKKVAIASADKFMERMNMITGKSGLESFLAATRIRVERSGFAYNEFYDESGHTRLFVKHGIGRTWSFFFCTFHERIVHNLGYKASFQVMEDSSMLTIEGKTHPTA